MTKQAILFLLCGAMAFGCGDDDATTDAGPTPDGATADVFDGGPDFDSGPDVFDAGPGDPDAGPPPEPTCANLCAAAMESCDGNFAAYASMAECMSWCDDVGDWQPGTAGDATGNTIACRITALTAGNCDAGGFTGGNVCGTYCENYCDNTARTCEGANAIYDNAAECMTACGMFDMNGEAGAVDGDTVQCRIYHGGIPADASPDTHCPHAQAESTANCVFDDGGFDFRMDAPETYTRVDRMGMPAVSTALAMSEADKAAYNDASPTDDAALTFAGVLIGSLNVIHGALDDDIEDVAGITPCSMDPSDPADPASLPGCIAQTVGEGGPSVVSLVVPDTLTLDTEAAGTFPNGRALTDPVIDVTLAVILLDLTVNGAGDLVGVLNPDANDVAFRDAFPYLAPAQ